MEENEEEYRLCAHCKKDVATANFVLHESHCRRFLSLCPDCREPVPREEMEQHRSEQHTQVRCTQCKIKLERWQLQDHQENECEGRLQCCQLCQLQLPFRNLAEHISACGSRTELCPDCNRYIKLRDMDAHSTSCSTRPQEGAPLKVTSQNAAGRKSSKEKDMGEISICPQCHLALPRVTLHWHETKCRLLRHLRKPDVN